MVWHNGSITGADSFYFEVLGGIYVDKRMVLSDVLFLFFFNPLASGRGRGRILFLLKPNTPNAISEKQTSKYNWVPPRSDS